MIKDNFVQSISAAAKRRKYGQALLIPSSGETLVRQSERREAKRKENASKEKNRPLIRAKSASSELPPMCNLEPEERMASSKKRFRTRIS